MWRPCKPFGICTTPRAFTRASPWTNIKAFPNGITLLYNVLLQGRDINDIHVIKSNTELIPSRTSGREHGPCPVALPRPHSSSTAVKCHAGHSSRCCTWQQGWCAVVMYTPRNWVDHPLGSCPACANFQPLQCSVWRCNPFPIAQPSYVFQASSDRSLWCKCALVRSLFLAQRGAFRHLTHVCKAVLKVNSETVYLKQRTRVPST